MTVADIDAPSVELRVGGQVVPALLSTEAAAKWLGVHPKTLRKWRLDPKAPVTPERFGSRLVWPTHEIAKVIGLPVEYSTTTS